MDLKLASLKLTNVIRQRNLFLVLFCASLLIILLLAIKIFFTREKVVMVPGIRSEMIVDGEKVSRSYLEESTLLYLSILLDLSPHNVSQKRDIILKYFVTRNKAELQSIKNYFSNAALEHEKFDMYTYFTPTKLELNPTVLEVLASGRLTSSFGQKGYESREATYYLSYELLAGYLRLKEFYEMQD